MALERIIIEITGDSTKLNSTIADLEKLGKVDVKNRESFEKTASTHKRAMEDTHNAADKLGEQFEELGRRIVAAFAVDRIVEFGASSVEAFAEAEKNAKQLAFAVKSILGEGDEVVNKLMEQSEALQKNSIFSDDSIQQAQTALATFGLTGDQIEALVPQILDLASASGTDLATATDRVILGINGQTKGLRDMGIAFKDTGSKTENLALLTDKLTKFQGSAAAAMETTAGKTERLKNMWDDFKEDVGEFLVTGASNFLDFWDVLTGKISATNLGVKNLKNEISTGVADQLGTFIESLGPDKAANIEKINKTLDGLSRALVDVDDAFNQAQTKPDSPEKDLLIKSIQARASVIKEQIIQLENYKNSLTDTKDGFDDATLGAKTATKAIKDLTAEILAFELATGQQEIERQKKNIQDQADLAKEAVDALLISDYDKAERKLGIEAQSILDIAELDKTAARKKAQALEDEVNATTATDEQKARYIKDIELRLTEDIQAIDDQAAADLLKKQKETSAELLKIDQNLYTERSKMRQSENGRMLEDMKDGEDKVLKQADDTNDKLEEALKTRLNNMFLFLQDIMQAVEDTIQSNIDAIDTQLTAQNRMIEYQKVLAEQGLRNDLAFEERRADELSKKKLEEQRKLKRAKELETFLNSVAKFAEDNPNSAVAKALGVLAATKAAEVIFAEEGGVIGANTNRRARLGQLRHRSGRDVLVQAERGERILSVEQNRMFERMGGVGLLKRPIYDRRIADSSSIGMQSNAEVVRELRELKEAVKGIPKDAVNWEMVDGRFERIETRIERGIETKTRSRFSH